MHPKHCSPVLSEEIKIIGRKKDERKGREKRKREKEEGKGREKEKKKEEKQRWNECSGENIFSAGNK